MINGNSLSVESSERIHSTSSILFGILIFGSLWGLFEIALGGVLRTADFPYRAALLTGVGMGFITGMALAIYRKPAMAFGIGVVAALAKLMVVPIQRVPVSCPANSCLAVILEASALGSISFLLIKKCERNTYSQIVTGASAALAGSMLFWAAGMHVAPCRYLLSFGGAPGNWAIKEGLIWATFSGILFPAGYRVGFKLRQKVGKLLSEKPGIAWAGSLSGFLISLTLSAILLRAGF